MLQPSASDRSSFQKDIDVILENTTLQHDDDYVGDDILPYDDSRYPEERLFDACAAALTIFENVHWLLTEDYSTKGFHYRAQNLLAINILQARHIHQVMCLCEPDINELDKICLKLWPGQPNVALYKYEDKNAVCTCWWYNESARNSVFNCNDAFRGLPPGRLSKRKQLFPLIQSLEDEDIRNSATEIIKLTFANETGSLSRPFTEHRCVLDRLRKLYLIDKYDSLPGEPPLKSSSMDSSDDTDFNDLQLNDKKRIATWQGNIIPLNDQNEYNVFARIAIEPGTIISFTEIKQIMNSVPFVLGNGQTPIHLTKTDGAMRTLVSRINTCLKTASVPLKLKAISFSGYKLVYTTQLPSQDTVATEA